MSVNSLEMGGLCPAYCSGNHPFVISQRALLVTWPPGPGLGPAIGWKLQTEGSVDCSLETDHSRWQSRRLYRSMNGGAFKGLPLLPGNDPLDWRRRRDWTAVRGDWLRRVFHGASGRPTLRRQSKAAPLVHVHCCESHTRDGRWL